MEIVLPEVWENRIETMASVRDQSPEEIIEEALTILYFMTVAPLSSEAATAEKL